MLKSTNLGALLFLLIFTIGCKDEPTEEEVDVTIDSEFNILLWESLEESSRTFNINVETIKSESCENTLIDVTPFIVGSIVSINIHDIPAPDCPSPTFVADANVEVGTLNSQSYETVISLKDVIENEGTLTVEDDYYELIMNAFDGIVIPENRLYKVPQNTIWGYIASDNSNADSVVDGFIDELEDVTDSQDYIDGYYGYFSALNNQLTILNQDLLQSSVSTFGFSYQGDNSDLTNILSTYRSQYAGVEFKIFTSKGEEL
jgi:hypothetical protein